MGGVTVYFWSLHKGPVKRNVYRPVLKRGHRLSLPIRTAPFFLTLILRKKRFVSKV